MSRGSERTHTWTHRTGRALTLLWITTLLFASACSGCDGESTTTTKGPDGEEIRLVDDDTRPDSENQYFMVPAQAAEMTGDLSAKIELGVLLYSKETGDPVGEQSISYAIKQGEDLGMLSALKSSTDLQGRSGITLRNLDRAGEVTVVATHPSANSVEMKVAFTPRPVGGIDVRLTNTAPTIMRFRDIDVQLYHGVGYSCNEFLPLRRQPDALDMVRAPSTGDLVAFDGLDTGKRYLITAIARSAEGGQIAAGGCVDDVRVDGDARTDVEIRSSSSR